MELKQETFGIVYKTRRLSDYKNYVFNKKHLLHLDSDYFHEEEVKRETSQLN